MKKLTALLLACMTFVCAAVSCGDKEKDEKKSSETTTASQEEKTDDKKEKDDEKKEDDKKEDDKKEDDKKEASDDKDADASHEEVDNIVKGFLDATISNDVETMVASLYPKSVVDAMKDSGDMDDFAASIGEETGNGKVLSFETSDYKKLSDKGAECAQQYFTIYAQLYSDSEEDFKVTDGYTLKLNATYEADGEKEDIDENVIAVMIDGEGWKLVPMSEEDLIEMVSYQAGDTEDTDTTEAAETTEATETTSSN